MSKKRRKTKMKLKKGVKNILVFFMLIFLLVVGFNFIKKYIDFDSVKKAIEKKTTTKKIPNINFDVEHIYLINGETYDVSIDDERVIYTSSDENIIKVEKGIISPIGNGDATVTVKISDVQDSILVTVTDLISAPVINNEKNYLPCNKYSEEEAKLLDDLLAYRINAAGYETRAGAVAAARFLALEFKYRMYYFYENGRLVTMGERNYVDGEGRYYHKGLYLHKSKFKDILASLKGPAIWGCNIYSNTVKLATPNGLNCSGFVSWLLFNAGFDVGDVGAGINVNKDNDLDDLGEKLSINEENLNHGKVKVGDLISTYGHIGILIGMENNTYYIAEALENDLHVLTLTKDELIKSDWLSFILMDEVYKKDGNLTNMW